MASLIGVSRVMSGYHFITDVAGGAVVGSSVGILIASVHNSPVEVVPVVNPETKSSGLSLQGSF